MELAILPFLTALTYVGDIGVTQMEHHWGPPNDKHAHFNYKLKSLGITAWHQSNFGFRMAYGKGEEVGTLGHYNALLIDFESVASFEILYKYKLNSRLEVVAGLGTYLMPMPRYFKSDHSPEVNDADDDEGYLIGVTYHISKDFSVTYRYTHYSQINSEYTKGNGIHLDYKF